MQKILQFHSMCRSDDIVAVKAQLIDSPELINSRDPYGDTPLTVASARGKTSTVQFLLDAGADINAVVTFDSSALMKAIIGGHIACCEVLLKAHLSSDGLDLSQFYLHNQKCVELSVLTGNLSIFKLFHLAGFPILNETGSTLFR
jgi:ankyrin repeat protein